MSLFDGISQSTNSADNHWLAKFVCKGNRHTLRCCTIGKNKRITCRKDIRPYCLADIAIVNLYSVRNSQCSNKITILLFWLVEFASYQQGNTKICRKPGEGV